MKQTHKYMMTLSLLLFMLTACVPEGESSPRASDDGAVRGLLVARAHAVSAATSALESLDRGETDIARSTLEGEVTSGLTMLYAQKSHATGEEAQLIAEAIEEGEAYAKKKNLNVIRPDNAPTQ